MRSNAGSASETDLLPVENVVLRSEINLTMHSRNTISPWTSAALRALGAAVFLALWLAEFI
jgi:hypothetical protein